MKKAPPRISKARNRLLETADRLFYKDGFHAVGIDRIIAEAGVAKMTLYSHFASKDELILAVLMHRDATVLAFFRKTIEQHKKKGKSALDAFFVALREWIDAPTFRGCAFINAAVEMGCSPAGMRFIREQKGRFLALIREVLTETAGSLDEKTVRAVGLLVEGAIVTAQVQGHSDEVSVAREAARQLTGR